MAYFVKGSDRVIAKKRWFLDRELGGYGLVDIHVLNCCIKSSWINRWVVGMENADFIGMRGMVSLDKPVDQWGVAEDLKQSDIFKYDIMCEWRNFKQQFFRVKGNIGMACLFENDGLLAGHKNLGIRIFGPERYNLLDGVKKILPVKCFCENGQVKTKMDIEHVLNIRINMAEYFRLRNFFFEIRRVYGGVFEGGTCLDTFMRGRKRGGGELRKAICGKDSPIYIMNDPCNVPSVRTLWGDGLEFTNRWMVELNFGLWGLSNLGSEFRMFIFNFLQGKLYLNNVVARFDNISPTCTFCEIKGKVELLERGILMGMPEYNYYMNLLPVESVEHLFWECPNSNLVIQQCYRWIRGLDWYNGNEEIEKFEFLIGVENDKKALLRWT